MKKYVCDVCGWVYDPAVGDPENGIEPGTAFEDIPEDWVCHSVVQARTSSHPQTNKRCFGRLKLHIYAKQDLEYTVFSKGPNDKMKVPI